MSLFPCFDLEAIRVNLLVYLMSYILGLFCRSDAFTAIEKLYDRAVSDYLVSACSECDSLVTTSVGLVHLPF